MARLRRVEVEFKVCSSRKCSEFGVGDFIAWSGFLSKLSSAGKVAQPSPGKRIWELLPQDIRTTAEESVAISSPQEEQKSNIIKALNKNILGNSGFYQEGYFPNAAVPKEAQRLLSNQEDLPSWDVRILNRLLIESAYPHEIAKSQKYEGDQCPHCNTGFDPKDTRKISVVRLILVDVDPPIYEPMQRLRCTACSNLCDPPQEGLDAVREAKELRRRPRRLRKTAEKHKVDEKTLRQKTPQYLQAFRCPVCCEQLPSRPTTVWVRTFITVESLDESQGREWVEHQG